MFVKKFEAASIEQALTLVKTEMGPDALILSTQRKGGKWFQKPTVEITAAFDKSKLNPKDGFDEKELQKLFPHRKVESPVAQVARDTIRRSTVGRYTDISQDPASRITAAPAKRRTNEKIEKPPVERFEASFLSLGFSGEAAKEFATRLAFDYSKNDLGNPKFLTKVRTKLVAAGIATLPTDLFESKSAWVAIGGPGVGKTSLLVKLAIYLKSHNRPVQLVSHDKRKVVGRSELASYARLLKVNFAAENGGDDSAIRPLGRMQLIDSPGVCGTNVAEMKDLAKICQGKSSVIVLDPAHRLEEMLRIVDRFAGLEPQAVAFTRMDTVEKYGVVYDVLKATKLPLLGVSVSRSFTTPFKFFDANDLATFLLRPSGL